MTKDNAACAEMPKYKCHKEVWALEIASVKMDEETKDGSATITPVNTTYAPFKVDAEYVRKHNPQVGGYYVRYEGGYESWSPKDVFDKGYAPTAEEQMKPKVFKDACFGIRTDIELTKAQVILLRDHPGIHEEDHKLEAKDEMLANVALTFRHLEDAKMRLGKAIQAYDGGASCYPR